jgi:hypothetical protein
MDDSDSVFGCRDTNLNRWLHTLVNDIPLLNPALVPGQMAICPGLELPQGLEVVGI